MWPHLEMLLIQLCTPSSRCDKALLNKQCPSSPLHETPAMVGSVEGTESVTDQYLLRSKPGWAAGHLRRGRAARHSGMAAGLLGLGALLQMLRRHDAGGWRRLWAASGQPGCALRHCARGPWLRWQLGHARWLLTCCTWRHALLCKLVMPLTVWHAD